MSSANNKLIARYSRRTAGSMILGTIGSLLLPQHSVFAESSASELKTFRVNIPQAKIDHIIKRVREAQSPDRLDADDWRYGANWDYMRSLAKYWVDDLRDYLISSQRNLTNYGKARRDGLRISSAPAESGMNHLINQRMGKRQPMRWSADGAHLLLQVRCAVLDHRLEVLFREWFPRFRSTPPITSALAA